jgi:hypothetical protein
MVNAWDVQDPALVTRVRIAGPTLSKRAHRDVRTGGQEASHVGMHQCVVLDSRDDRFLLAAQPAVAPVAAFVQLAGGDTWTGPKFQCGPFSGQRRRASWYLAESKRYFTERKI